MQATGLSTVEVRPKPGVTSFSTTRVPLLDTAREIAEIRAEVDQALARVLDSGMFILGPECEALETAVADYCDVPFAIGCGSGSDALLLSLMACDIGPGDEVIVPSFTFFATAAAVTRLGATPVFVDIEPDSFNIDPTAVLAALTHRTKALIPVHLFGQSANMIALNEMASAHNIIVVEDAAQAIGARHAGQAVGSLGTTGCFSFYPTKNLGACGDAGMVVTQSAELAAKLRKLRVHGMQPRYYHELVGVNSRIDAFQSAILNVKMSRLPQWTAQRVHHAAVYAQELADVEQAGCITLPSVQSGNEHVWNQYTIRVHGGLRDHLRSYLQQRGIGCEVYYPVPLHEQACFSGVGVTTELPQTQQTSQEVLSLPIWPGMTSQEQAVVIEEVCRYFGRGPCSGE